MKCEHGKYITIVVQLDNQYIEDGYEIQLEGCDKCKPISEERKNTYALYLCNMANICKRSCSHHEEHEHTEDCNFPPPCAYNRDAECEKI